MDPESESSSNLVAVIASQLQILVHRNDQAAEISTAEVRMRTGWKQARSGTCRPAAPMHGRSQRTA